MLSFTKQAKSLLHLLLTPSPSPHDAAVLATLSTIYHPSPNQSQNHHKQDIPGLHCITRKDALVLSTQRMQRTSFGAQFNYLPHTYVIPQHANHFTNSAPSSSYIVKPSNRSCGDGISIHKSKEASLNAATSLLSSSSVENDSPTSDTTSLISSYIPPFLIHGHKFDLRMYALVIQDGEATQLRSYLYTDGLVRFCTTKYKGGRKEDEHDNDNTSSFEDLTSHLTNYTINSSQTSAPFVEDNEDETRPADFNQSQLSTHKWSVQSLILFLPDSVNLIEGVREILGKVSASVSLKTENRGSRYELLGLDLMLDEDGKIFMLEVQRQPSMQASSRLDLRVKGGLVNDMKNLLLKGVFEGDKKWLECGWENERDGREEANKDQIDLDLFEQMMKEAQMIEYNIAITKQNGYY